MLIGSDFFEIIWRNDIWDCDYLSLTKYLEYVSSIEE